MWLRKRGDEIIYRDQVIRRRSDEVLAVHE
jgi:hypothetical protein